MEVCELIKALRHNHVMHFIIKREQHTYLYEGGVSEIPDEILISEVKDFYPSPLNHTIAINIY